MRVTGSGARFDEDVFSLGFAECQVVTADFDFKGISQRSRADESDASAGKETHFTKPNKSGTCFRKLTDNSGGTHSEFGQLDHIGHKLFA